VTQVTPHPKPQRKPREKSRAFRHVATIKEWRELRDAKYHEHPCRICGSWNEPAGLHHIVPRSLGGDDRAGNLVRLCGTGTTGCHGHVENRSPSHLIALARTLTEREYLYVIGKLGEGALERLFGADPS
jgi:5-methylcytosine-specific restriction endonuclease McrA